MVRKTNTWLQYNLKAKRKVLLFKARSDKLQPSSQIWPVSYFYIANEHRCFYTCTWLRGKLKIMK